MEKEKIAVLLTCHNRRSKTLLALEALYKQKLDLKYSLHVYLVDDGSTDGTALAVQDKFPSVRIIDGNGSLFWNQGMRLAWKTASYVSSYDFYFWLNDDTILYQDGLEELLECFYQALELDGKESLITGACCAESGRKNFSYGGRSDFGPVIPSGKLQKCKYINGNAVLIPKGIYRDLGNLSSDYTHGMGDFDYGLRAQKAGFNCYTSRRYMAVCPPNEGIARWCNPATPLRERLRLINSPQGLNLKEYNRFRRKHWGYKWIFFAIKAYIKVLYPSLYFKMLSK